MRLNRVTLTTAIGAVVQPLDPHKAVMLARPILYGSSDISATAQVDGTLSDLGNAIPIVISRATTVLTVTFPAANPHTLGGSTDYVVISGTGNALLDGVWPLATVTNNTVITMTSPSSGTISATAGVAVPLRFAKTVIASAAVSATAPATFAASTDTGLVLAQVPFSAYILKCTIYAAGTLYLDTRQAGIAP